MCLFQDRFAGSTHLDVLFLHVVAEIDTLCVETAQQKRS